jgi:NADH dehydrogenase FAD-containing subunit
MSPDAKKVDDRPHVVVLGAGFGGLTAAKALASVPVRVTVLDRTNHHTFQPASRRRRSRNRSGGSSGPTATRRC